jgi:serine/threonine protein kinase
VRPSTRSEKRQVGAALLKALLHLLDREDGRPAAERWLHNARLVRSDLEDETRALPLAVLHSALRALPKGARERLEEAAPLLLERDNLGAWARVIRGATSPEEAFKNLAPPVDVVEPSVAWESLEARPGMWRGRVRILHDFAFETDGLLAQARAAELSVVPMLFGYPRGSIDVEPSGPEHSEVVVTWAIPSLRRYASLGALVLGSSGLFSLAMLEPLKAGLFSAVAALLGAAGGLVLCRQRLSRIEATAQATRVRALERSLALRENERRASAGSLTGAIVAGQYRIAERLGSGASGVIYEATRITDGTNVAIKILRAATAHDVTASDRLRRESEALGLAWHPNVVEVYDHGYLADGTAYLVMELLCGETLASRLVRRTRLSSHEVFTIAFQIAEALAAIHAAGVVHRDLKPSNVYLVAEDDSPNAKERVKVFDFGIARVEWEELRITNMGASIGTPGYMSPEQESGLEVDHRSDLYAFGALLYECFVGDPPPASREAFWIPGIKRPSSFAMREAMEARADSGVHPASRKLPSVAPVDPEAPPSPPVDVSPAWRDLVERLLAKRPDERFDDARAVLRALRAMPSEGPVGRTAG